MSYLPRLCLVGGLAWLSGVFFIGCTAPHRESPWEPVPTDIVMAMPFAGQWNLVRLGQTGAEPKSYERRTLTMKVDGSANLDLWEHQLTYKYVVQDASHVQFTWTASTNPNDQVGATFTWVYSFKGDELTLNGDVYQRGATPSAEPTVILTVPESVAARLNEPFTLKIGQSALLQDTPDDFGVVFQLERPCPIS